MDRQQIIQLRLNNQLLRKGPFSTVKETIKWMGALQGQDYNPGLWAISLRTYNAKREDILQSLEDLTIVRSWTMRHTIHFIALEDLQWMIQVTKDRMVKQSKNHILKTIGLNDSELLHSLDQIQNVLMNKKLLSRLELREELEKAQINISGQRYYHILRYAAESGLIFIGPMQERQQTIGLVNEWAPKNMNLTKEIALQRLSTRYLQSHGPATLKDFSWWSGLTLKEAKLGFESTNSDRFIESETSKEYWYLPDNHLHESNNTDKIHLIYSLDEFLIGYKDRTASWPAELQSKLDPQKTGFVFPILFNGEVVGSWKPLIDKSTLRMNYVLVTSKEIPIDLLNEEAERYSNFFELELAEVKIQKYNEDE